MELKKNEREVQPLCSLNYKNNSKVCVGVGKYFFNKKKGFLELLKIISFLFAGSIKLSNLVLFLTSCAQKITCWH